MEKTIKILKDTKNYYIVEIEGRPVKLLKIDKTELEFQHTNDLFNAASIINPNTLNDAIKETRRILENIPTVDKYERVADYMVRLMNVMYDNLNPYKLSYLMHHMIKNIDPNIYGKAQTFMDQIKQLNKDLEIIKKFTEE